MHQPADGPSHIDFLVGNKVDTIDVAKNLTPQTYTAVNPACESFEYHREYGTVGNPVQLATGFYLVTVAAKLSDGKRHRQSVSFSVDGWNRSSNSRRSSTRPCSYV